MMCKEFKKADLKNGMVMCRIKMVIILILAPQKNYMII